jgi:probable F420-dependent oxidoreductase
VKIGILTFFSGCEREPLPEYLAGVARILEEREFRSIWLPEHVVGFQRYDLQYRYPYSDDGVPPASLAEIGIIDPMSALTALAMCSSTLQLCTGIAILAQRNPVYFAKMGAAIDRLSNGRFVAGVGLGWSGQEFEALGVSFERRGARTDEYVQVVRSLWESDVARFEGEFYRLPQCVQLPKPIRPPSPPFYFGGESDAALRRVAKYGRGWIGYRLSPEELAPKINKLHALLESMGRPLKDVDLIVSPADKACDSAALVRYAQLGVSQVVIMCVADNLETFRDQADQLAGELVTRARTL